MQNQVLLDMIQMCVNSYPQRYGLTSKNPLTNWDRFSSVRLMEFDNIALYDGFYNSEEHGMVKVVCFRGSDEWKDWLYNIDFEQMQVPYSGVNPEIKVHTGFIEAYKKTRDYVLQTVSKYDVIFVVGHSLGGALTTLASLDIKYNNPNKTVFSFPFSAPKVGNKRFVESYNDRMPLTYRCVLGSDPVTKVPFKILHYDHVKSEMIFKGVEWYSKFTFLPFVRLLDHYPHRLQNAMRKELLC